jgi:hypothetical protein
VEPLGISSNFEGWKNLVTALQNPVIPAGTYLLQDRDSSEKSPGRLQVRILFLSMGRYLRRQWILKKP